MEKLKQIISEEDFFKTQLPGTTRVIGEVFGSEEFSQIPTKVLEAAIDRGKRVHEAIEHFIETGEDVILSIDHQPYYDSFKQWYDKYQPTFLASEFRMASEDLGFKGIADVIFLIDNTLVVGDFKTSGKLGMLKVTFQLNMYRLLLLHLGVIDEIKELRVIKLEKKTYKYVNIQIIEEKVWSLLALFKFKRELGE